MKAPTKAMLMMRRSTYAPLLRPSVSRPTTMRPEPR